MSWCVSPSGRHPRTSVRLLVLLRLLNKSVHLLCNHAIRLGSRPQCFFKLKSRLLPPTHSALGELTAS